ncbi:hypothetical protein ACIOBL_01275 [Paenibacillus taichungensis]|uniref:hypothetical protein n=1 Tax=Paenibacillus taichungensis TaxID=484184 RepID=UPI00381F06BE
MDKTVEKFTELLDERLFEVAKELRDELGCTQLVISQESIYSIGLIEIKIREKTGD